MFDVERAISRWRERQQRETSLAPRELDELEDHLRARMDLELELNPELTRTRAFGVASRELGDPRALSGEFARAGRSNWKGPLAAGWGLFAASFMMPAIYSPPGSIPHPPPFTGTHSGWEVFVNLLSGHAGPWGVVSALSGALIPLAGLGVLGRWKVRTRRVIQVMVGATGMNLVMWMPSLHVGYYAWLASFALVTIAWWLRDRDWSSARPARAAS